MEMTVSRDLGESLWKIADQICAETLPRPRFKDGDPVQFGDMISVDGRAEKVQGFKFYKSGPSYISVVGVDHEKWVRVEKGELVKRLEVLDADGVPIKAGDMVWRVSLPGFGPYKVHKVDKIENVVYLKSYDYGFSNLVTYSFKPDDLTHKGPEPPEEPSDSWERIVAVEKETR